MKLISHNKNRTTLRHPLFLTFPKALPVAHGVFVLVVIGGTRASTPPSNISHTHTYTCKSIALLSNHHHRPHSYSKAKVHKNPGLPGFCALSPPWWKPSWILNSTPESTVDYSEYSGRFRSTSSKYLPAFCGTESCNLSTKLRRGEDFRQLCFIVVGTHKTLRVGACSLGEPGSRSVQNKNNNREAWVGYFEGGGECGGESLFATLDVFGLDEYKHQRSPVMGNAGR